MAQMEDDVIMDLKGVKFRLMSVGELVNTLGTLRFLKMPDTPSLAERMLVPQAGRWDM
jgi:hypothetical protein